MSRGDSSVRLYCLMQLLEQRQELGVCEAAAELGCSRRTLYRDLTVLERIGFPLYQDKAGKRVRWRVLEGRRQRVTLRLSWSEMLALFTGRQLLSNLAGTVFHEACLTALDKLRAALPAELVRKADTAGRSVTASSGAVHDYRRRAGALESLVAAIEQQRTVVLAYRKPRARSDESRRVDPYHLHVQSGAIYLIGYCHERAALRTFLVDRVAAVHDTDTTFVRRPELSPADHIHGSFGPWRGKPRKVSLRFTPDAAPFVEGRRMHPSQSSQLRADGSLDVTLRLPLSPAFVAWVVSWGPRVAVLTPGELRERVWREHAAAAEEHRPVKKSAEHVTEPGTPLDYSARTRSSE